MEGGCKTEEGGKHVNLNQLPFQEQVGKVDIIAGNINLNFKNQISSVVRTSFFQLRIVSKVKSFLSFGDFQKGTLISSRLDYCSALYTGISQASHSFLTTLAPSRYRI